MELGETIELRDREGRVFAARRLTVGDTKAVQDFDASLSPQSRIWFMAHGYDDETCRKILTRSARGDDLILGLFDGDRMVGYFFLWYFTEPTPLLGVGLNDACHRRGLGRAMMEVLIDAAKANGNEGIELTTMVDNEHAFALYQEMGFEYHKDVENLQGDGSVVVERAMFYRIKPDAQPMDKPHAPPA